MDRIGIVKLPFAYLIYEKIDPPVGVTFSEKGLPSLSPLVGDRFAVQGALFSR